MSFITDLLHFPFKGRQEKACQDRSGLTKRDFVTSLVNSQEDESAANLLWDFLVDAAVVKNFIPHPDDNFLWMYGLAEEDLDEDIILEILKRLGIDPPTPGIVDEVGEVTSPKELMRLVRLSREAQA